MRTRKNSTRNTSTKSANNQQRKSFSNNLVILTGNLGADAAFSASMTVLPHSAWPPRAPLAKKNTSNGTPW